MKGFYAIYRKEISHYFVSPVAYAVIGGFLLLAAILFVANLKFDIRFSQYFTPAWQILEYNDVVQGLLKPFMFAMNPLPAPSDPVTNTRLLLFAFRMLPA